MPEPHQTLPNPDLRRFNVSFMFQSDELRGKEADFISIANKLAAIIAGRDEHWSISVRYNPTFDPPMGMIAIHEEKPQPLEYSEHFLLTAISDIRYWLDKVGWDDAPIVDARTWGLNASGNLVDAQDALTRFYELNESLDWFKVVQPDDFN